MNKRLIIIVLGLWSLTYCAFGQANVAVPYDPGAARDDLSNVTPATGRAALGLGTMAVATSTDYVATSALALRLDTTNASFSGDIDVTGDVGAATVNGVVPLTAAEKTQALVGSATVNFLAQNLTAYPTTSGLLLNSAAGEGSREHIFYTYAIANGASQTFTFNVNTAETGFAANVWAFGWRSTGGEYSRQELCVAKVNAGAIVSSSTAEICDVGTGITFTWANGAPGYIALSVNNSSGSALYDVMTNVKFIARRMSTTGVKQ